MELVKKEPKKLTDKQQEFLDVLFTEAKGDPKKAGEIVGYSPNHYLQVVKSLKEEILNRAEYSLALHSGKAVQGMIDALDEDGTTPKGELRLKAAESLLNRIGIGSRETIDHNVTAIHGVVLLPNKQEEKIINE